MRWIGAASAAVAVGALSAAALASLWRAEAQFQASCEPTNFGDCISFRLPVLLAGPLVVTALVWLALRVSGVGRAVPLALLGVVVTADALLIYEAFQPRWTPPSAGLAAVLGGVGFGVGVLLGVVRLPTAVQVGAAALLLLPYGFFPFLHQATRRADQEAAFSQLGVPLLVAQVEGYRVGSARADRVDRKLSVSMSRGDLWLTIVVVPVPAGFAPPAHCGPDIADLDGDRPADAATTLPCRPVGPDHWVQGERADPPVHLIRRDGALVYVNPGVGVPAADLDTAAARLTEVTPQQLTELTAH